MTAVVNVTTVRAVMGNTERGHQLVPWRAQTLGEVAGEVADWGVPVTILVDGQLEEDHDLVVRPGSYVVVLPGVNDPVNIIVLVALAVISAVLTRHQVKGALAGLQDKQERNDNSSQTYAWDGITTDYGPGGTIPLVYGEHDVGGTVVHSEVISDPASGTEILVQHVVLCHGRIDSVGGVDGGIAGEADDLGLLPGPFSDLQGSGQPLPEQIRVNGNLLDTAPGAAGAVISLRMGSDSQRPFKNSLGTFATEAVQVPLDDINHEGTASIASDTVSLVRVALRFPSGLYGTDPNGNPVTISRRFRIEWRERDAGWTPVGQVRVFNPNTQGYQTVTVQNGEVTVTGRTDRVPFTAQYGIDIAPAGTSLAIPIEIRVTRLDARGDTSEVDSAIWTNVSYKTGPSIAYSGLACAEVILRAQEKFYGSQPQLRFRARGRRVRVWDPVEGWSAFTWAVPAAPFDFHLHPPGNNPAWVLLDFILHEQGLGNFVSEEDIDLQSFRDLADYCDQELSAGFPRYRFDGVFDTTQSAMDVIRQILNACEGTLAQRGRQLVVRYSYRDAHGSRPARATWNGERWVIHHQMLFNAANASDIVTTWLDTSANPSVIDADILNQALDYERDPVTQEDPDALGLSDPGAVLDGVGVRRQPLNLFGVTRAGQARYMALRAFKGNRFGQTSVQLTAGPAAIGLEPGDLIGVQTDAVKPAGRENHGMRLHPDQTLGVVGELALDRDLVVPADEQWAAFVVVEDDAAEGGIRVEEVWLPTDPADQTFLAGDGIALFEPHSGGTPTTIDLGSELTMLPVALGPVDLAVKTYEVNEIQLREGIERVIGAIEWHPEQHDVDLSLLAGEGTGAGFGEERRDFAQSPGGDAEAGQPVAVRVVADKDPRSQVVIWESPGGTARRQARVFMRPRGALDWQILGQTLGNTLTTPLIPPGAAIDVAVALENPITGGFPTADEATSVQVTTDEFPALSIPGVTRLTATRVTRGVHLSWERFDAAQGIDHYEVRVGAHWMDARVVGRTEDPEFVDEDANWNVFGLGARYMVKARHRNGLYSRRSAYSDVMVDPPADVVDLSAWLVEFEEETLPGTADQMAYDGPNRLLTIAGEHLHGTYTTQVLDAGFETEWLWSIDVEHDGLHLATLGELDFELGSGEALWWTLRGREASPRRRAPTFRPRIEELAGKTLADLQPGADLEELQVAGPAASVGRHTGVQIEIKLTMDNEDETPWMPYTGPIRRTARSAQWRLRCDRSGRNRVLTIRRIYLFAGLQT